MSTCNCPLDAGPMTPMLRMSVSRSIGCHGFDVETFARIELPVWLSYALGGGRASKAAAKNLGKPRTLWYANTFHGWANAGGNGAAMRIQPHVWASRDLDRDYMLDVITDTVCSHGHPRAIVGACFHAATLAHCISTGTVPDARTCADIARSVGDMLSLIDGHRTLGTTWIALWQEAAGRQFSEAWQSTSEELYVAISSAMARTDPTESIEGNYARIVARLGLRDPEQQGSGILTTVAARRTSSRRVEGSRGRGRRSKRHRDGYPTQSLPWPVPCWALATAPPIRLRSRSTATTSEQKRTDWSRCREESRPSTTPTPTFSLGLRPLPRQTH